MKSRMPSRWRKTFRAWSKRDEYKKNLREAKRSLRKVLDTHNCIVLYSGGKDSLVVLHLTLQYDPNIPVYHYSAGYDYEVMQMKEPKAVRDEIIGIAYKVGVKPGRLHIAGGDGPSHRKFFGQLRRVMDEESCDVELLGIRAGESITRRERVKDAPLVKREGSRLVCFPIKSWSWMDVWAYIVSNDLPYLSLYDEYARVYGYDRARWSMLFSGFTLDKGGGYYFDGIFHPEMRNETPEDSR